MTALLIFCVLQDVDAWLKKLRDDDAAVRQEAARKLIDVGSEALPKVGEALAKAADEDLKLTLGRIAAEIERRELHRKIKIELVPEKDKPNDFTIRITNENDAAIVLFRYFSLNVLDKDGHEVKRVRAGSRWGQREHSCFPENVSFMTLGAKETQDLPGHINDYTHDLDLITGWKLSAGEYTLKLTHAYDRAALVQRCKDGCVTHEDPAKPWNRAVEFSRTVEAKVTVKD